MTSKRCSKRLSKKKVWNDFVLPNLDKRKERETKVFSLKSTEKDFESITDVSDITPSEFLPIEVNEPGNGSSSTSENESTATSEGDNCSSEMFLDRINVPGNCSPGESSVDGLVNCICDNSEESVKESTAVCEDVIRPSEIVRDAMNVPENSSLRKSKPSVDDVYDNSEVSVKESNAVCEDVIRPSEVIPDAMNVPENSSLRKSKPSVDDLVNDVCIDNQEEKEYVDDEVCESNSFVTMDKTDIERSMQAECSTVSSNIKLLPSLSISTFHSFTDSSCENSKVNLEGIGHLSSNNVPSQAYSNSKTAKSISCSKNSEISSALPSGTKLTKTCQNCKESFRTKRSLDLHHQKCKSKPANIDEERSDIHNSSSNLELNLRQINLTARKVWGDHTYDDLLQISNSMYDEVVCWRKNIFKLPSGSAGKLFIRETTRLIEILNEEKLPVSNISLKLLMIMPAILLQKPYRNSNSKLHSEYLRKRLVLWDDGKFDELMREARSIQERFKIESKNKSKSPESIAKNFAKLMLLGKVNAALRLLDKETSLGVANITEETMGELKKLHPEGKQAEVQTLMKGEVPYFDPIIFHNIDESSIAKAAQRTKGAAGPSGLDADGWRRILVSKNYGKIGKDLRSAISKNDS